MPSHFKGDYTSDRLVKYDQGKDTLTIMPRALDITWGGDPRYWKFSSSDETSSVELLQVCWLQVKGKAKLSYFKPGKEYAVKFKVTLKPDNFGWANGPVYLMAGIENLQRSWKKADLSTKAPGETFHIPIDKLLTFKVPNLDTDKDTNDNKMVDFGIYEIWKGRWKGGLVIHELVIEPAATSS